MESPATTLVLQFGSAFTRYSTNPSADRPKTLPTIVSHRVNAASPPVTIPTASKSALEARDAAAEGLSAQYARLGTSGLKRKQVHSASRAPVNAFFEDVQVVRNYSASNAVSKVSARTDSDWKWTDVGNRNVLVGTEALQAPNPNEFELFYPIRHGRLNVLNGNSRKCLDALECIVTWILKDADLIEREQVSVSLVVPDAFSKREVYDVVSMLFRMQFAAVAVHLESVLSCFGAGVSSACVVDIGAQKTVVACVRDGVIVPHSVFYAPFGGDHIDQVVLYLCEKFSIHPKEHSFNLSCLDLKQNIQHVLQIRKMRETSCFFNSSHKPVELKGFELLIREYGKDTMLLGQNLQSAAVIAPMGLFETQLLVPSITQDCLDIQSLGLYVESISFYEDDMEGAEEERREYMLNNLNLVTVSNDEIPGLDQLIASSIVCTRNVSIISNFLCSYLRVEDNETRKLFAKQILLVGGCAKTHGLNDELEEKLIQSLPRIIQDIELVDVLEPKESDHSYLSWKGASIMAQCEGFKGCFITQNEWTLHGAECFKLKAPFIW